MRKEQSCSGGSSPGEPLSGLQHCAQASKERKVAVETSTRAENLGRERWRTGVGQGINMRCQTCTRLLQKGRE